MRQYTTKQKKQIIEMSLRKLREDRSLDWNDIIESLNLDLHPDTLRRWARGIQIYDEYLEECGDNSVVSNLDKLTEKTLELKKAKIALSDERRLVNAKIRELTRLEDFYKKSEAKNKDTKKNPIKLRKHSASIEYDKEAVLMLSDWHYGMVINNDVNKFNSSIAIDRVSKLVDYVIKYCSLNKIEKIHVLCLGDLISGEIHSVLRVENREILVEQIDEVSDIISSALDILSKKMFVEVDFTFGNHERTGDKDVSLNADNFTYLIEKFVSKNLKGNKKVTINKSKTNSDLIYKTIKGRNFVGVHGHQERKTSIVPNLSAILKKDVDVVCIGHFHSQSNHLENNKEVFINGSLCGTDEYAYSRRLFSEPSQKLLIVNNEGIECVYNIKI